ncbi:MAG: hypothetical protein K0Q49_1756 [Haloplasmataceae bacterium]|nr:hypothetical protein [Haloplasmataceae bacterium]
MDKNYYNAYEVRYKKVYEAGIERWGHSPNDPELVNILTKWVEENQLRGKSIIEFACGEGASGLILSHLGCTYHGIDISQSALNKSREILKNYPNATVSLIDMVNKKIEGSFDAALDVMGFHMLVVDSDREKYLKNAYSCLKGGSPMLFFRESYRIDAYEGEIESFEKWKEISGEDYDRLHKRIAKGVDQDVEVYIPLVPSRAKTKNGYQKELSKAGFIIDHIKEMDVNINCPNSVTFFVHRPKENK